MTFARVICDNTGIDQIQTDVFKMAEFPSGFVSCSEIPELDLSAWREDPNGLRIFEKIADGLFI